MAMDTLNPDLAPANGLEAPEDWTVDLLHEGNQYTAVVARKGVTMCRLSIATIATSVGNEASARTALADKARWWIHDYLGRQPTGL